MFIRKLTQDEQEKFSSGVIQAVAMIPSFRDAVALLRPYLDETCGTAYVDRFSRMGLSEWFFNDLNTYQRASIILHESMHVLNNHFVRGEKFNSSHSQVNIAQDFEINTGLQMLPSIDMDFAVYPEKDPWNFQKHLSFEQYLLLLDNQEKENPSDSNGDSSNSQGDSNGDSSDSQGDSNGDSNGQGGSKSNGASNDKKRNPGHNHVCDEATEERSEKADEAGVERASKAEQNTAKRNAAARITEELKDKSRSNGSLHEFLKLSQRRMAPPKVKWQDLLRRIVAKDSDAITRGRDFTSFRRVNRRSVNKEYILPGMVQYKPSVMLAVDSSGSMSTSDYNAALNEIEGVLKSLGKGEVSVFFVDSEVDKIQTVRKVSSLRLTGGGGTDMSTALDYVNGLGKNKTPDLFVLVTDGFTDWDSYQKRLSESKKKYRHILLITDSRGFNTVTDIVKSMATVIDISSE